MTDDIELSDVEIIEKLEKRQRSFANSISVIMTQALDAAKNLHIASCQNAAGREHILKAMHQILIVAEQCRQEMAGTAP